MLKQSKTTDSVTTPDRNVGFKPFPRLAELHHMKDVFDIVLCYLNIFKLLISF